MQLNTTSIPQNADITKTFSFSFCGIVVLYKSTVYVERKKFRSWNRRFIKGDGLRNPRVRKSRNTLSYSLCEIYILFKSRESTFCGSQRFVEVNGLWKSTVCGIDIVSTVCRIGLLNKSRVCGSDIYKCR